MIRCKVVLCATAVMLSACHVGSISHQSAVKPLKNISFADADSNVYFNFDSTQISPIHARMLNGLVSALKRVQFDKIIIIGRADSFGSDAYNNSLSLKRAQAVKAYLLAQGIDERKITLAAMGKQDLLVTPDPSMTQHALKISHEKPNRRVSLGFIGVVVSQEQKEMWARFNKDIGEVK